MPEQETTPGVEVLGRGGALGHRVADRLAHRGAEGAPPAARVLVTPPATWGSGGAGATLPTVAAAVRQRDAVAVAADVPVAGWWGGLGTLLAAVALGETEDARELHVAYGLPGTRGAYGRLTPTLRTELLRLATDDASARVAGERVPEPLGEGRRLAWFPAPVGPAHAVAVGGLEHLAPLDVPTVRTWFSAGSLRAELLQAIGRTDPDRGVGAWLLDRAAGHGGGPRDTAEMRWAVVVEVRDGDDEVVRAWANGTDPLDTTAEMLTAAALRLATRRGPTPTGTLLDLGPASEQLDRLADAGTLRWSVARPQPSPR